MPVRELETVSDARQVHWSADLVASTPGEILARMLRGIHQVRSVIEYLNATEGSSFIVVGVCDDSFDVASRVYAAESCLYESSPRGRFHVRVTSSQTGDVARASGIVHLRR